MRRATENRRGTRMSSAGFSPKSKGEDLTLQGCVVPRLTSSQQEMPMRPSQIPNKFPYSPPRRALQLQSPKLHLKDRLGTQFLPFRLKPLPSPRLHRSSPAFSDCAANMSNLVARNGQAPRLHSPQPSGTTPKSPLSPSGICHPTSPELMKGFSSHSAASNNRPDQAAESGDTVSSSASNAANPQSRGLYKHQWPQAAPALKVREAQKVCPSPGSESSSQPSNCRSLPNLFKPAASSQDRHHKQTSLCEKSSQEATPCTSMKRKKQMDNLCEPDKRPKKLCSPTVERARDSLLPSQASQPPPVVEPPLKDRSAKPVTSSTSTSNVPESPHPSTNACVHERPSVGAKRLFVNSSQSDRVSLFDTRSPPVPDKGSLKKRGEEADKGDEPSLSSASSLPREDTGSSPCLPPGSCKPGHSASAAKTASKGNAVKESRKPDVSTAKPVSKTKAGCHNKAHRPQRPVVIPDDISELFKPDPCVIIPAHKTAKPKTEATVKTPSSEKRCSDRSSPPMSTLIASPPCHTQQSSPHAEDSKVVSVSSAFQSPRFSPTVLLHRVKLENLESVLPKDTELKTSPTAAPNRELKDKHLKPHEKHKSTPCDNERRSSPETPSSASDERPAHLCPQPPGLEPQENESAPKEVHEEDLTDMELDIGLSFAVDLDMTQSSASSEEDEELLSLQEMMQRVNKPPETPKKEVVSKPSTERRYKCQSKHQPVLSATKSCYYKNTIDQMLKEIDTTKKAKALNKELMSECQDSLLQIAEDEKSVEDDSSSEDQEFLLHESLSKTIRDLPPGVQVFNLEKSGHIFNHNTLQLRQCLINPQGSAEKTLLWSSPAQLRLHIISGLFQEAYQYHSPCPTQVTRFLFKMMSIHTERLVSEKILQALCDIASSAAYQRVKNERQEFEVWVPSLADVALVLLNMGASFVTLFPPESLQPPFTEGDLLEDVYIKTETPDNNAEQSSFHEHNLNNILKYLSYCMGLCPLAYSDDELLLLLTVVGRVGLDTRLILQASMELYPLQYKIVNNFRDWDAMLLRACLALTDLTGDHRNMCQLVQMLPDSTRGKQLRQHLSVAMISKLLNGKCTYRPKEKDIQLSDLKPYIRRIRPLSLRPIVKGSGAQEVEDTVRLDQQCYSLCYSLLTLVDIASHIHFFSSHQKEQLLSLSYDLEKHIKSQIREGYEYLDRVKVKDLVARIDTRWQRLVLKTKPLHAKLHDFWRPPGADK